VMDLERAFFDSLRQQVHEGILPSPEKARRRHRAHDHGLPHWV
jgi:hypothetical protein